MGSKVSTWVLAVASTFWSVAGIYGGAKVRDNRAKDEQKVLNDKIENLQTRLNTVENASKDSLLLANQQLQTKIDSLEKLVPTTSMEEQGNLRIINTTRNRIIENTATRNLGSGN